MVHIPQRSIFYPKFPYVGNSLICKYERKLKELCIRIWTRKFSTRAGSRCRNIIKISIARQPKKRSKISWLFLNREIPPPFGPFVYKNVIFHDQKNWCIVITTSQFVALNTHGIYSEKTNGRILHQESLV